MDGNGKLGVSLPVAGSVAQKTVMYQKSNTDPVAFTSAFAGLRLDKRLRMLLKTNQTIGNNYAVKPPESSKRILNREFAIDDEPVMHVLAEQTVATLVERTSDNQAVPE